VEATPSSISDVAIVSATRLTCAAGISTRRPKRRGCNIRFAISLSMVLSDRLKA